MTRAAEALKKMIEAKEAARASRSDVVQAYLRQTRPVAPPSLVASILDRLRSAADYVLTGHESHTGWTALTE